MHVRTTAFIDKLAITISIDRAHWDTATHNLLDQLRHDASLRRMRCRELRDRMRLYQHSICLSMIGIDGSRTTCAIQFFPTIDGIGYLRLEWTPSKAGYAAIRTIVRKLANRIPSFWSAWRNARISRVDVAVDIHHLPLSEVVAFHRSAAAKLFPHNPDGVLTGFYIGAVKSKRRFLIYDKAAEQRIKQRSRSTASDDNLFPLAKTRIEGRFLNLGFVRDIRRFDNQFEALSVTTVELARTYSETPYWQGFVDNSQYSGAQHEIQTMACQRRRASHRSALNMKTPNWFNKDEIWREGIEALSQILKGAFTRVRRSR